MTTDAAERKEKATQTYAALGIGLVCLVVGLPLWWKTTEVYRVQLPYGEIAELAESEVRYVIDFTVLVADDTIDRSQLAAFSKSLRESFETLDAEQSKESRLKVSYRGNVRHLYDEEKEAYDTAASLEDFDQALHKGPVAPKHGKYTIAVLPKNSPWLEGQHHLVGHRRTAYVSTPTDFSTFLTDVHNLLRKVYVMEKSMSKTFETAAGARHLKTNKASMRSLRSHPGYEVTFTLLNPQPDILDVKWDITTAIEAYLNPLVATFSEFTDLTLKSQYMFYTWLGVKPQRSPSGDSFFLKQDSLPHIINPIEAQLSSHVSNNPNLNFVVYIPSRDQHPLHILDSSDKASSSNSFLSPRWGGILVYNVDTPQNVSFPAAVDVDMRSVMEVFISQLRLLLGVNQQVNLENVAVMQPGREGIASWELDQWLRSRSLENIATTTATLSSLAQLLEQISNIVINDDIGQEVEEAVAAVRKSKFYLSQGKLKDAYLLSRKAILSSEKAFFDPSLLELLYFPEDQKFAIYIPLFLPISIPVFMSLIQAAKWIRRKDKLKTE